MLMDVPQYAVMIRKLAKILRPGGMMILVESELTYVSCGFQERQRTVLV